MDVKIQNIKFQLKNMENYLNNIIMMNNGDQIQDLGIQLINMGIEMINIGFQYPNNATNIFNIQQQMQIINNQIKNIEIQMNIKMMNMVPIQMMNPMLNNMNFPNNGNINMNKINQIIY